MVHGPIKKISTTRRLWSRGFLESQKKNYNSLLSIEEAFKLFKNWIVYVLWNIEYIVYISLNWFYTLSPEIEYLQTFPLKGWAPGNIWPCSLFSLRLIVEGFNDRWECRVWGLKVHCGEENGLNCADHFPTIMLRRLSGKSTETGRNSCFLRG